MGNCPERFAAKSGESPPDVDTSVDTKRSEKKSKISDDKASTVNSPKGELTELTGVCPTCGTDLDALERKKAYHRDYMRKRRGKKA